MQRLQLYRRQLQVSACLILSVLATSCYKDFSYEYMPVDNGTVVSPPVQAVSSCAACQIAALPDSAWQVTIDEIRFCGTAVKPVVMPERTAFTFFGPSFCSSDSGFVASVFLGTEALDSDRQNLKAQMSCYYYDNVGSTHVYLSSSSEPLEVFIDSYTHQTGIATGVFRGVMFDRVGRRIEVKNGRFRIKL